MAIRSAMSYVINEEDGFVAVDFDYINRYDDGEYHDLTSWELIDQADEDVDDCSSIGEKCDDDDDGDVDICSSEYYAETIVGEDENSVTESILSPEKFDERISDEEEESVPVLIMSAECLEVRIADDDAKSVPESIMSPECLDERISDEDVKSIPEKSPAYMYERIGSPYEKIADDSDVTAYRSGGQKYYTEEEEEEEAEDDYELDDELIPYYVNGKLGRERMRKLGKRSCTKSIKSKRLTHNYNKAGCFRGKHGLGLKHSLM